MKFSTSTLVSLTLLSLIALHPVRADDVATHLQKAQAAASQKDWDGALVELDAAIALDKNNVQAHTGRAMMLLQKQNIKDAITEVSRVIELDPKNAIAYKLRASLYQQTGDKEKSKDDYIAFLRLSPEEVAKLEASAKEASTKEDWANAVGMWDLVSQVHPNDAHPFYERGKALQGSYYSVYLNATGSADFNTIMRKLKTDTKASFDAAIKADPKFVPAYLAQDDADVINQGLKVMPENADLLVARADMSLRFIPSADTLKAAFADYEHALKIDPKSTAAFAGRAHAYLWDRKYDLALADTARSLELKPNDFDMLRLRSVLYNDKNDYANEIIEEERALAIKPGDTDLLYSHYFALTHLPDKTRAFTAISKLIDTSPLYALYRVSRAQLYFDQKDYAHASADVAKALELEPDNADAIKLRAKIADAQK